MLAKLFVKKGLTVSVITTDHGQQDNSVYDGVRVLKTFKKDEGIPGLRFFFPRLYRVWKSMKVSDSDVYYVRCAGYLTGIVALFCRLHGKKSVFAAGHDTDFIPGKYLITFVRDKWLHQFGLRMVSTVIVQSKQQRKLLLKYFNRSAHLIRNFSIYKPHELPIESRQIILWVSTLREWKRPELFLELAKNNPDKQLVMIGGPDSANIAFYKEIEAAARDISNLDFKGFQPIENTERYFDQCKVFVNTSVHEGFPNTFLQAWRRGIPVLSFFDPDNIIEDNKLGLVVKSDIDFYASLSLVSDIGLKRSREIIAFFCEHHSDAVLKKYIILFESLGLTV